MQKRLLLLGGSAQQVVAIKTAKRLGYLTVLCDYLPDNPGQYEADSFYLVSTTDKEAVLQIALQEQVDGILAYASDPAAPTAAYVAEHMGLPTNPYDSVDVLCNKDKFRDFLLKNNFNTPVAKGYSSLEDAINDKSALQLPLIIKPVDSSGSKGVTVLHDFDNFCDALEFAFEFSRCHRVIIENFVEKNHPYLIGGDIFVLNGKIVLWGLLNCHRDETVNQLVPVGKSFPLQLGDISQQRVKETLQKMVDCLKIKNGAMNVELVVDKQNNVWPIDVGPRNGGNMIPDLLCYIFGIDIVEMSIKVAMGETPTMPNSNGIPFYATHNLHTNRKGIFENIVFSPELEQYIIRKNIYKTKGDAIDFFDNAAKALGIIFLKFPNQDIMGKILNDINSHITICLKEK